MLQALIRHSLQKRLIVLLAGIVAFVWGIVEVQKSSIDIFPDLTAPTVTVITESEGMSPLEIEKLVSFPLENALNGLSGLRRIRSNSLSGVSVLYAEFEWGTDIYLARQLVTEKLQLAQSMLPQRSNMPVLAPISSVMGEIMFIALHSKEHDAMALKTTADWQIRQRILALSGISDVISVGGETKQFHVLLKPEKLIDYDIRVEEVLASLSNANTNSAAGFYLQNDQEFSLRGVGRIENLKDIRQSLIAVKEGHPIRVGDVAEVKIGAGVRRGIGSFNAKEAVVLAIQKQPDANTLALTKKIDETLIALQSELPSGMIIEKELFRQSYFIEQAIENLLEALLDGAILVIVIVLLFLLSIRATLITLTAIPLSLIATIFLLNFLEISINTMTLGGMAIALGVLVDDAIIVVENIIRRLELNAKLPQEKQQSRLHVITQATFEIQSSIVFATLIIMLVFLPLFFLDGLEGRLMAPLGLAYISSLIASLFIAMTLTPVMSYYFLKVKKSSVHEESKFLQWLLYSYETVLRSTMYYWKTITLFSLGLLGVALFYLFGAGKSFLPAFNEGSLTISMASLPGTAIETSGKLALAVEKKLLDFNEVKTVTRRTGRGELDPHALGVHASEIEVTLEMKKRSKEEFLEALRAELKKVSGLYITIGQPISHRIDHMLSGSKASIAIKVFGEDIYERRKIAEKVKTIVESVEGTVDVMLENSGDLPQVTLKMHRDQMALHGISVVELSTIIETAFYGTKVTKIIEGNTLRDLVLKYKGVENLDLEKIKATLVKTSLGSEIPLHSVVEIAEARMPYQLSRENGMRKTVLTSNVAQRDVVSVVGEIQARINAEIKLPKGYRVEYGGQFKSATESTKRLMLLSVVVFLGVFLLLFMAFNSLKDALLILVNLPLALIGGVVGLYYAGGVISVATLIGFITLFGIATRNGVIMIAHIHNLMNKEGVREFEEAVRRGAKERLIPIIMTAFSAGLAMVPLAMGMGEAGSEIQAPMAMVILFGLFSSTLLNMVVLPALYLRFGEKR
ncbi:MAG: CusA/CzcA family heavy metal efflux RND transporter [Epsilonproteobacteria bacterium]|nr:CusA/CzcA family heavy metal efflux RND transporter [Campylobacterota bacterium]